MMKIDQEMPRDILAGSKNRENKDLILEVPLSVKQSKLIIYLSLFFYTYFISKNVSLFKILGLYTIYFDIGLVVAILTPYLYLLTRPGLFSEFKPHSIQLYSNFLRLPKSLGSKNYCDVAIEEIYGVILRGSANASFLVIETRGFTRQLPVSALVYPDQLVILTESIERRVADKNPEELTQFNARNKLSRKCLSEFPIATIMIVFIISASFSLQQVFTHGAVYRLPGLGANSSIMLVPSQWYRLFTSALLHSGAVHWFLNMAGLAALGYTVESIVGTSRLIVIFICSIMIGALASALGGNILSVGASAGLFGLLGAYAYLHVFHRPYIPIGFFMRKRWWVLCFLLNLSIAILVPRVDNFAHIGGFFSGLIASVFLLSRVSSDSTSLVPLRRKSLYLNNFAKVLGLVFVVACTHMLINYSNKNLRSDQNLAVMKAMLERSDMSPMVINSFAWEVAIDVDASKALIELAHGVMTDLVVKTSSSALKDTYATLLYRMGKIETAIAMQSYVFMASKSQEDQEIYGSQLVRFIKAKKMVSQEYSVMDKGLNFLDSIDLRQHATILLTGNDLRGQKKILFIAPGYFDSREEMKQILVDYSDIEYIGTLEAITISSPVISVNYMSQVDNYASYDPEEFFPEIDLLPYRQRLFEDNQLLL